MCCTQKTAILVLIIFALINSGVTVFALSKTASSLGLQHRQPAAREQTCYVVAIVLVVGVAVLLLCAAFFMWCCKMHIPRA
ncbi:hypothetical protein BKA67DRAFT_222994 [Truncatella angustata]|uniref:Uncharacterized protein n=1 Tax=Truncatella angustata TaxID=152316 RepID=A0A9P8ULV8_9PEZI|nr:uncharacterized protein BKA67DRAFT_222994 [Truncatella angustata]KAH6654989.1 hypothetical protein BKA67DRAFT_222994 [Truncatella angustata]